MCTRAVQLPASFIFLVAGIRGVIDREFNQHVSGPVTRVGHGFHLQVITLSGNLFRSSRRFHPKRYLTLLGSEHPSAVRRKNVRLRRIGLEIASSVRVILDSIG